MTIENALIFFKDLALNKEEFAISKEFLKKLMIGSVV